MAKRDVVQYTAGEYFASFPATARNLRDPGSKVIGEPLRVLVRIMANTGQRRLRIVSMK
jgi:hypothetical protein